MLSKYSCENMLERMWRAKGLENQKHVTVMDTHSWRVLAFLQCEKESLFS